MKFLTLALVLALAAAVHAASHSGGNPTLKRLPVHKHPKQFQGPVTPGHHAMAASLPTGHVGGDIWPVSIFWTWIDIGTPAQKLPVAIDSGSFTLNVPGVGCDGCISKPPNGVYNVTASSSGKWQTCAHDGECTEMSSSCVSGVCAFSNTYETCVPTDPTKPCTISGPWATDVVSVAGSKTAEVTVGTITKQTAGFYQFETVDGVMGMAGPPAPTSVITQLAKQGAIPYDMWSICLASGSAANGTIVLGGYDESMIESPVVFTENTSPYFYQMQLDEATLGGTPIRGTTSELIIDSGTNDLLLPTEAFDAMRDILVQGCKDTPLTGICNVPSGKTLFDGECYTMTAEEINAFPTITFKITSGLTISMSGADYVIPGFGTLDGSHKACLAISPSGPGGLEIIGDTIMQNYLVVFERMSDQIGWAPLKAGTCGN